ncbi:MAG: hypothetical protein IPQ18_02690 [Saprospiraceae bacterium]|nr:hypothetical protein [Saprospiraceae bacterium]
MGSGSVSNGPSNLELTKQYSGSAITGFSLDFLARMFKSGTNNPTVSVSLIKSGLADRIHRLEH